MRTRTVYATVGWAWAASVAFGLASLWHYEGAAGEPAKAPTAWPAQTGVPHTPGTATLVLFAHPRCPCTRATMSELARLMTDCRGHLTATVLMVRPAGAPAGWAHADLWRRAAAITGVTVMEDAEGHESRRFGAATSGQALLYGPDGTLLFAGGITESRGHEGDNAGRSAITALVMRAGDRSADVASGGMARSSSSTTAAVAPVYGCPLFDPSSRSPREGEPTCCKR